MTHYIEVVKAARETVAKMLTQRTGQTGFHCTVTTRGGRTAAAHRNGDYVNLDLPSLSPDTVLTRAEADRMVAYLVHEVCHMLHTDFTVWNQAVKEGTRVQHWTNALEDVRIEAHEMRIGPYKAMRSLLSGLVCHLYAEAHARLGDQGKSLGQSNINGPYILTILGREANKYDVPIVAPLKDELSPMLRTVMARALSGVKLCKSTMDCLVLARELAALEQSLKQEQPQQPQPPKQKPQQPQEGEGDQGDQGDQGDDMRPGDDQGDQGDQGDDQGEGDQGDDQGESQESGQGDDGQGAQEGDQGTADDDEDDQGGRGEADQGDETGENSDQGDDQGQTGDAPGGNGHGGKNDDDQDVIAPDLGLGKTAEDIIERTGKSEHEVSYGHQLNNMTATRRKQRNIFSKEAQAAADHLKKQTPTNGVLFGQISRLLVSEARTARTHHETSGRLDRRALVRMRTGAPDVFSRRDDAPGIDTAVLVLIDLSGSMAGTIELARIAAWALADAAESAGGKLAIAGFHGGGADCTLYYVKDWGDNANQSAGALMSMRPSSSTPLSASIIAGAQDLAEVQATRRIMMVLTDGQCDLGGSAVKSACALAEALGTETVGIGLACASVVKAFPARYSVNVENLKALATTGLGTLTRMLEETGAR